MTYFSIFTPSTKFRGEEEHEVAKIRNRRPDLGDCNFPKPVVNSSQTSLIAFREKEYYGEYKLSNIPETVHYWEFEGLTVRRVQLVAVKP